MIQTLLQHNHDGEAKLMTLSEEGIHLAIGRAEALVLFEMLAEFHDQTCLQIRTPAERLALVRLQATLEKALVEPFIPEYRALINEAESVLNRQSGKI